MIESRPIYDIFYRLYSKFKLGQKLLSSKWLKVDIFPTYFTGFIQSSNLAETCKYLMIESQHISDIFYKIYSMLKLGQNLLSTL